VGENGRGGDRVTGIMPEKNGTIAWLLRVTVALQCLGNWRWLAQIGESPLLSWLLGPVDVGGLGWSEATALATHSAIGWAALVAGVCVLVRPCFVVTLPLVLLQLCITIAMWRIGYGFKPLLVWLPPEVGALFPFLTQAARISAPLGLLLLVSWGGKDRSGEQRAGVATSLMRWAIGVTFFAHGVEALQHHPAFIDLLIGTAWRLFGAGLPQSGAERLLTIIGVLDVAIALACVATKIRGVLWWMAIWGGITAVSRTTAFGFEISWHQMLVRMPHVGVPIVVVLLWHLLPCSQSARDEE